ncbi:PREDICTED: exocyst complex component 6 isoform X3 [Propithecus coquereli]|uniref:Exocyst complex component n=1 Tax=Propithecus coquereli TaxID=379532 RepID=A0A2K6GF00_PROCO|nr:PREDICTED: exocyst complex component 6 isoform X3 [Propithecus coquereli]
MAESSEGLGTVPEHERILQEIESTDTACVGPTLRSVYDDQPNAHKKFMEKLDACIRNHDKEIEKMCNFHHQGFVDAITELLKVRTDAEKLKVQVTDTNRRFQDAGKEVIGHTEDIIRCRIQQRNITTVVEKLQLCLPVLEMYSKLKEQMSTKRYYSALKTMEQLEKVYFPRVSQYRFCQLMIENLPKLRGDIKEISMSDLKDFLESIRKHSDKIGETAMKQAQHQKTFSVSLQKQNNVKFGKNRFINHDRIPEERNEVVFKQALEEDDENEEEGDKETFENYYRKQRKKQARLVLQPQSNMGYGFLVNRLFELLCEIRDQYNETLLKKWTGVFRDIFEEDNYSPIPIVNEEEYKSVISKFPFQDPDLEKQPFPKKFPMSQSVPHIYIQVKEFIYASLKFSESLHRSSTEIDDMLRKSTNLLLTRTLSGCLLNLIRKPHIGLTELVQIIINTTHLEQACKYLEDFITNITNISQETVHTTRLYGLSTFKDARHAAEGEIYTKLNQKIDEFVQLADYDWTMSEPDGRASGYLMDLINFLRSIFQVFTHLPGKVAQTACMSACQHLSTSLMRMLLDSELKQISMGAVQQFNLDVIQCELFASSEPVPGFQGDTLQLAFIDLRQLLDLFMVWDWSTYLADYGQPASKYLRVNPNTALILLEKMKDTSKKNNIFAQFRKNDRDKQKLIETVVKQLRSLVNGMSQHT